MRPRSQFVSAGIHRGMTSKAAMKLADKLLEERRARFLIDETIAAAMHVRSK